MKLIDNRKLTVVFLLIAVILCGWVYRDSFNAYFFQDDWFSFRISQATNINDFFSFFIPRSDVIYYRPLGMQTPFFFIRKLFGVNPFPFHILTFITHGLNVSLVYLLIRELSKNRMVSLLSAFCYSVSAVNYIPFYWSSTYAFILGPTFFYLSFIYFLRFLKTGKNRHYWMNIIVFMIGLLTYEINIIIPLLISLYLFLYGKKEKIMTVIPLFLIGGIYILIRMMIAPVTSGQYSVSFGKHIVTNMEAYLLWSFNWPEEMKAQLVNFFTVNPLFIKNFKYYYYVFITGLTVNLLFLVIIPVLTAILRKKFKVIKDALFGIGWFVFGLIPVIFFTRHAFSYYLPVSLVGMLFALLSLYNHFRLKLRTINGKLNILLCFLIFGMWVYVSVITVEFNSKVHWAPRRAKISEKLVRDGEINYPPGNSDYPYIYVRPSSENRLSINDQDGFKIVFNDDSIVTIFQALNDKAASDNNLK